MNQRSPRDPDRRHHVRIEPKGTVSVHAHGNTYRARLVNIGAGGMYVTTAITLAERLLGRVVELELRFDGPLAVWQRVTGRIARIDASGAAIVFDAPGAPALRTMIEELTTASHASARVISVVLIDADPARRAFIATGFRATGCAVVEAATPLDAIVRLGESDFEPDVIAVANSEPAAAADAMRAFIGREHAASMLIAIGPELLDPAGLANWLSSGTAAAGLPARIRELLFSPPSGAGEPRDGGTRRDG